MVTLAIRVFEDPLSTGPEAAWTDLVRVGSFLAVEPEPELRARGFVLRVGKIGMKPRRHGVSDPSGSDRIPLEKKAREKRRYGREASRIAHRRGPTNWSRDEGKRQDRI